MLAVGLYHDTVGVYDVRKAEDECLLENSVATGKHSDAVWQLVWLNKGPGRGEALVSVSAEGRVTQWTISEGLECSDLNKLKRVASHKTAGGIQGFRRRHHRLLTQGSDWSVRNVSISLYARPCKFWTYSLLPACQCCLCN